MNLLLEATFFNFKYITGIERCFFLKLEIFEKIQIFDEIYIVVKNDIPERFLNYNLKLKVVKISDNSVENWRDIYENYKFDLIYSTFVPPPILPSKQIPMIYTLHDPGRYIYPEFMERGTLDEVMKLFDEYVKSEQFYVVTLSESSKKDILKYFPALEGRTFVVYCFISKKWKRIKSQNSLEYDLQVVSKDKFFLTVGRYIPTKNTLNIVKAFERRSSVFEDFKLVIVGRKGWYKELNHYLENYKSDDIFLFDNIEEKDLFPLYKNCYGLISASIYEGFGLPLIEARFCGCERIFCSDIPVYREINLRDVIYFDPLNYLDLRNKVFINLITLAACPEIQVSPFSLNVVADKFKEMVQDVVKA
ncbi:MAG: glycosyltransferase family 4 protein [Candidatus Nealsonbacteria bacterium]